MKQAVDILSQQVKALSEQEAGEVLAFIEFLQYRKTHTLTPVTAQKTSWETIVRASAGIWPDMPLAEALRAD